MGLAEFEHKKDEKINGRYVLQKNYLLQAGKEEEDYNVEQEITLKTFPYIKMILGDIFEGIE